LNPSLFSRFLDLTLETQNIIWNFAIEDYRGRVLETTTESVCLSAREKQAEILTRHEVQLDEEGLDLEAIDDQGV